MKLRTTIFCLFHSCCFPYRYKRNHTRLFLLVPFLLLSISVQTESHTVISACSILAAFHIGTNGITHGYFCLFHSCCFPYRYKRNHTRLFLLVPFLLLPVSVQTESHTVISACSILAASRIGTNGITHGYFCLFHFCSFHTRWHEMSP